MGQLIYDGEPLDLRIDDRALTHLQIVIVNMLRREHRFAFSWKDDAVHGNGRSTIRGRRQGYSSPSVLPIPR